MKPVRVRLGWFGLGLFLWACVAVSEAQSDQVTTNVQVQATVAASVELSASGMNFGTFARTAEATGQGALTITATNGLPYTVYLSRGNGFDVTGGKRAMSHDTGEGFLLLYDLFTDPEMTSVWGDGTFGNAAYAAGTGTEQQIAFYGKVPGGQPVPTGSYSDLVVVTVLF
jgi:spore coat protein U domain-containing protein, fimbrial subunit CupE1/2/3/6